MNRCISCTCHVTNGMVIKCIPSVNMPLIKKDACHDTFQYYSLKHYAIVHCIHKIIKVQDVWYHGAHIYIYILYDIFIRVSKNERHRLGWMKSWNWNLVATRIIRRIDQRTIRNLRMCLYVDKENSEFIWGWGRSSVGFCSMSCSYTRAPTRT
jgi:hypothetical protein